MASFGHIISLLNLEPFLYESDSEKVEILFADGARPFRLQTLDYRAKKQFSSVKK